MHDLHRVQGFNRQGGLGNHGQLRFGNMQLVAHQRLAHNLKITRIGVNFCFAFHKLDVVSASVQCDFKELIFALTLRFDNDVTAGLELPGNGASFAQIAIGAREQAPNVTERTKAVIGDDLHQDGDAMRAVALIQKLF